MTGSAFSRWTLHWVPEAIVFTDKGEGSGEGERSRFCLAQRLADLFYKNCCFFLGFTGFFALEGVPR